MSRPTDLPDWATDTNYTTGDDTGTATKITPLSGFKHQGWIKNFPVLAQYFNYWMNLVYQWVVWLDSGSVADLTALAALADLPDGTIIRVGNLGAYRLAYAGVGPTASDGYWLINASVTGQPTARWVHTTWNDAATQKIPPIGPVPNEVPYTFATAAGKINPDVIPHGHIDGSYRPATNSTTTNGTLTELENWALGVYQAGWILKADITAYVKNTDSASIDIRISENNGSTWTNVTPSGGAVLLKVLGSGESQAVPLSFVYLLAASGNTTRIQIRGSIASGATLTFQRGNSYVEVVRP
jgi:hypothetical protein